jgi:transposase
MPHPPQGQKVCNRTVFVDLEKRIVIDVLSERSADATAKWLSHHPDIEVVSRDRCGLYAQGAARGAPKARQVADRFHLLDNLRLTIVRIPTKPARDSDLKPAPVPTRSRPGFRFEAGHLGRRSSGLIG